MFSLLSLLLHVSLCAGLQQNSLLPSAGELHPDIAS